MPTYLLKAIDILCNILLEYIQRTLPYLVFGSLKCVKPRRSFIRIIGSSLPLPKAPRVCFNFATWRQNSLKNDIPIDNTDYTTISNESSNEPQEQKTIKKLEQELEQLKTQVALILENQKNFSSLATNLAKRNEKSISKDYTPPPPPPPLPTFLLSNETPSKQKKVNRPPNSFEKPSAIDALITEMKNGLPKLKPIARSPGGRPLRRPCLPSNDPTDMLTEALRRRFSASQYSDDSLSDISFNVLSDIQTSCN